MIVPPDSLPATMPPPTAAAAPPRGHPDNAPVAECLLEMARLLQAQGEDSPFRVAAYQRAAATVARLARSVREIARAEGLAGLDALPTIGPGIACAIDEIVRTGRWSRLERLRGAAGVEAVFRSVPGIGELLAHRLHEELGVDTLEALEAAAHDGRLAALPGIGERRAAALAASLTHALDRRRTRRPWAGGGPGAPGASAGMDTGAGAGPDGAAVPPVPSVAQVLQVDARYRALAGAGRLPLIAPRRFNPEGRAWLPVLHMRAGDWHFTALYSNTARAHTLDRVRDWVVVYAEGADHEERPFTVVTAQRGTLAGRRVVRGRETECRAWYAQAGDGGAETGPGEDDVRPRGAADATPAGRAPPGAVPTPGDALTAPGRTPAPLPAGRRPGAAAARPRPSTRRPRAAPGR